MWLGFFFFFFKKERNGENKKEDISRKKHLQKILQKFCKENREWHLANHYAGLEYTYQVLHIACHVGRSKLEKEIK